jgi:nucleoid-associated protein YgaU
MKKSKTVKRDKVKPLPFAKQNKKLDQKKRYLFLTILSIIVGCATGDISENDSSELSVASSDTPVLAVAQEAGSVPVAASPPAVAESTPAAAAAPAVAASPVEAAPVVAAATPEAAVPEALPVAAATPEAKAPVPVAQAVAPATVISESSTPAPVGVVASATPSAPIAESVAQPAMNAADLKTYKVRKFDTLMKISFKLYGSPFEWSDIYQTNKDVLRDPNFIRKGMKLKYKPHDVSRVLAKHGHKYRIKKGDTLSTISLALYGTSHKWKSIWSKNNDVIHDPQKIMAGLVIYYTGGQRQVIASQPRNDQSAGSVGQDAGFQSHPYKFAPIGQPQPTTAAAPSEGSVGESVVSPAPEMPANQAGSNAAVEVEPTPAH